MADLSHNPTQGIQRRIATVVDRSDHSDGFGTSSILRGRAVAESFQGYTLVKCPLVCHSAHLEYSLIKERKGQHGHGQSARP